MRLTTHANQLNRNIADGIGMKPFDLVLDKILFHFSLNEDDLFEIETFHDCVRYVGHAEFTEFARREFVQEILREANIAVDVSPEQIALTVEETDFFVEIKVELNKVETSEIDMVRLAGEELARKVKHLQKKLQDITLHQPEDDKISYEEFMIEVHCRGYRKGNFPIEFEGFSMNDDVSQFPVCQISRWMNSNI